VSSLLERVGGFYPALVALALPVVYLPGLGDLYILPRASIVIAGACIGTGLALLVPARHGLGALRWPVLAAVAAAFLAFAFSINWGLSFAGSYTRYESLPTRLSYLGLLASAAWLIRTRVQRDVAVAAFVAGSSIASVQALLQAFSHAPFRPDGNLGNANLLAALLAMAIPLAVDRVIRSPGWWAAAWAFGIVVMAGGMLVTTSRSGLVGVAIGLGVVVTFLVPRRFTLPVGVAAGIASGLLLALFFFSPLRALNGDPPELRFHLWEDALRMIAARPLTGWGEDTTGLIFGHYLSLDYATLVTFDRVHSGPLDLAANQGVAGLVATGAVVGVVLVRAWRGRAEPGVAGLAAALVGYSAWVFFNFDWSPVTGAFWLLAGVLWSSLSSLSPSGERVRVRGAISAFAAIALVLVAIVLAVFPILADAWSLQGRADLAVRVDPLQAQYHAALGTLPELQRAADLGDTDPGLYVSLGDAYQRAGDRARSRAAYERALQIDPWYTPAFQRLQEMGG
jgi:O-antigen ligase